MADETPLLHASSLEQLDTRGLDRRLVLLTDPGGSAAEQYRLLAHRLAPGDSTPAARRIGVTSPGRGDGRSLTAANLALALAARHRVVLVDGDLRHPSQHQAFGLAPVAGLVDLVAGRARLDEALIHIDARLAILPAGATVAPYAVASSPRLRATFDEVAARFELAVIDLGPALPTADVPTMAQSLDGLLMVVRAGRTLRDAVALAVEAVRPSPVIGCVLNAVGREAGRPWQLLDDFDRRAARPASARAVDAAG